MSKEKCEELESSSVSLECGRLPDINPNTYIMNLNDCVIENGKLRIKRKYGKFKRPIYKMDYGAKDS